MSARSMVGLAVLTLSIAAGVAALTVPASARTVHRHTRVLHVTRSRGLPVPPDPLFADAPNFTGQNGRTTDVNVLPDLSVGDGFPGFQTPGLDSYGFAGGGLSPYQLQ